MCAHSKGCGTIIGLLALTRYDIQSCAAVDSTTHPDRLAVDGVVRVLAAPTERDLRRDEHKDVGRVEILGNALHLQTRHACVNNNQDFI